MTDFIEHEGLTYKVSPLTLLQQEELASYLRFQYIEETKRLAKGLPESLFQFAWTRAKEKADNIVPGRQEHAEAFYSPKGLITALILAGTKHQPISEQLASAILQNPEAVSVTAKAVGYERNGQPGKPEALPIDRIIHTLCNVPFNYSPQQVKELTLEEIALIWVEPESEKPQFGILDQQRLIEAANQRNQKRNAGIWEEKNIWN